MKRLCLITILGIVSLTTAIVLLRERSRSRAIAPEPPPKLLSFSRAQQTAKQQPANAAPSVPIQTESGHALLIHNAIEQAPAWAIPYGQEFWHKGASLPETKVDNGAVVPANIDLGNIIERISAAITLGPGAALPQAHTKSYAATFDGEGFRLSPHRFGGHRYEMGSAGNDFREDSGVKARTVYEPDPSTELRFKTASIRIGGTE